MSHDISDIENKLVYDKYLFTGPNLCYFNGNINDIKYLGSFYWMNPKKIYNKYYNYINIFIQTMDKYLFEIHPDLYDDTCYTMFDNYLYYIAENIYLLCCDINYLHHYQSY